MVAAVLQPEVGRRVAHDRHISDRGERFDERRFPLRRLQRQGGDVAEHDLIYNITYVMLCHQGGDVAEHNLVREAAGARAAECRHELLERT